MQLKLKLNSGDVVDAEEVIGDAGATRVLDFRVTDHSGGGSTTIRVARAEAAYVFGALHDFAVFAEQE